MAREVNNTDYAKKVANLEKEMAAYEVDYENKLNAIKFHNLENLQAQKERYIEQAAQKESKNYEKQKAQIISEAKAKIEQDKKYQKLSAKEKEKLLKKETEAQLKELNKITAAKIAANAKVEANRQKLSGFKSKKINEKLSTLKEVWGSEGGKLAIADELASALSDIAKQLENQIDSIGSQKGIIDTALQGSKNSTKYGSYWSKISSDLTAVAGISPLVKQSDIASNLQSMVTSGIAFNVEQRAFLQTIKSKIADTFDATDGTLLRLIRVQQQDSTASRLGMESALTAFLNNMYENTEYLKQVASGVKTSLEEAMSLMSAVDAVGFEYQVQKWMGSLYSVGMSHTSVSSISQALGQISAGDISGLTGSGTGNLLVMAANVAGMSIADILQNGLTDSETNRLMEAMVEYLSEIASETKDSKVVQQQIASVYGITASDLRAASNLSSSISNISRNSLNYNGGISRLYQMAGSMYSRTGTGELLSNMWDNAQYSLAAGIASNPALYAVYKAAGLIDAMGGMDLPEVAYLGTEVNLQTSLADLMRAGALGSSMLGMVGKLATGGGGISGLGMLTSMGVLPGMTTTVVRGSGSTGGLLSSGSSVSSSGMISNVSGSDLQAKTVGDATDDANKQLIEAQEQAEEDTKRAVVDEHVMQIYNLLERITTGADTLHVVYDTNGYGL
jgi:hypothetical protein